MSLFSELQLVPVVMLAVTLLGLTGCATSTIESRKEQRPGAYAGLNEPQKQLVDSGQIKVGMSMDAVYIAWGKPDQILNAETSSGPQIRWLYLGSYLQSFTHWTHPGLHGRHHYHYGYSGPELAHDYVVLGYVRAEVIFEGGLVREWRHLPKPGR